MSHELQRKYRPKTLSEVVGQEAAVSMLREYIDGDGLPHSLMLIGPPGTGKTSTARILARDNLKCGKLDIEEVDCAAIESAIEHFRSLRSRVGLAPTTGPARVWILDEVQSLSRTKYAQEALLKVLEEPPDHAYFFLCTTNPSKVISTIRSRCKDILFKSIPDKALTGLLSSVVKKEKSPVTEDAISKIVEVAQGGARDALKLLGSILRTKDEDKQLDKIKSSYYEEESIKLCRALISEKTTWPQVAKIIQGIEEDPENMRRMILGYMSSALLKGGKGMGRIHEILKLFEFDYFNTGRAGLVSSCYQAVCGNR